MPPGETKPVARACPRYCSGDCRLAQSAAASTPSPTPETSPASGAAAPTPPLRRRCTLVLASADLPFPDASCAVDEIQRRPVLVSERAPDHVIAVDRDRIR